MNSPYRAARERFGRFWPSMNLRMKLRAVHLTAGEMFWAAVGNWSRRMQEKVREGRERSGH